MESEGGTKDIDEKGKGKELLFYKNWEYKTVNFHKNLLDAILASLRLFIGTMKDQFHHYIKNDINFNNLTCEMDLQLLVLLCNRHQQNK